jgi:transmembrane sensor
MKLLRTEKPPQAPADGAIWWATRRQIDPARFANDAAFAAWATDPANASAWAEIDRRVQDVGSFASMPEIRAMRGAALDIARDRAARSPRTRWSLAAAIAASIVGGLSWIELSAPVPTDQGPAAGPDVRRFATGVGQRRDVVLADGSKVTLNTASLIEVRYAPDRRDIRLLEGQAMFHVAKNPGRPFVVSANDRQVTAFGTTFDVRIRQSGQVQVLLVEGRVRVEPTRRQGLDRLIPALARTDLRPGEEFFADASGTGNVTNADVERETAWDRGVLIFRNDSVGEAVREINRYSAMQLLIDDPGVASLKISGIFPTASREDFIAALQTLYPVAARPDQGGIVRLGWRREARHLYARDGRRNIRTGAVPAS